MMGTRKKVIALMVMGISALTLAEQPLRASAGETRFVPEPESHVLKEVGITLGTPAALNLNLGFWGTESLPLLVRASGMYYGGVKGIQADLGLVANGSHFRPFVAATLTRMKFNTDSQTLDYTGLGPSLGFNLYGFQLQTGLAFALGQGNLLLNSDGLQRLGTELTVQIGYSFIW